MREPEPDNVAPASTVIAPAVGVPPVPISSVAVLSTVIAEERIQCITRMTNHLTSELEVEGKRFAGLDTLAESMSKLYTVLTKTS